MTHNVILNAMSGGDTMAAEEIDGIKYENVKINIGAFGVNDGVVSDAIRLPVKAGNIIASETSFTRPSDTTTYAAGDAVNNSTSAPTVLTFANIARLSGLGGVIESATMILSTRATLAGVFELWLFDTTVTMTNDNTAWGISDANLNTAIGCINFSVRVDGDASSNCVYQATNIGIAYKCTTTSLFGVLVARNAYVPGNAEVFTIRLKCLGE